MSSATPQLDAPNSPTTRGGVGCSDLLERRAKRLAYKREWNRTHPGHWRKWPSTKNVKLKNVWRKTWKQKNRDKVRSDNKRRAAKRCEEVSLTYVRNHWTNKWGIKTAPTALLEAAATIIKIQREIKTYGKTRKHRRTARPTP